MRIWQLVSICVGLLLLVTLAWGQGGAHPQNGVSGMIHFTDGRQVKFNYLGSIHNVGQVHIQGYIGTQRVEYLLDELGEIHFSNPDATYIQGNSMDELLIISKAGDQFTMRGARVTSGRGRDSLTGRIRYVYHDPITRELRSGVDSCRNISHITLGNESGPMKRNPQNGQYFPSIYNYDPFTGDKLEWTSEPPAAR